MEERFEDRRTVRGAPERASTTVRARLACGLWVLIAVIAGLTLVLVVLTRSAPRPDWHPWMIAALEPVACVAYALPGFVIARRRPRNPIGWLLLVSGFGAVLDALAHAYALYAIFQGLPGGIFAAWVSGWAFAFDLFPVYFLLLLFPNGRLPSALWRIPAWFVGGCAVWVLLFSAFVPGPIDRQYYPAVTNPLGSPLVPFADPAKEGVLSFLFVASPFLLAAASLLRRFVISGGTARQQIKWVAFAALVDLAMVLMIVPIHKEAFATVVMNLASVVLSTAIAIAIMRHRLFDIDRILSRSLLYTTLTASAIGLYAASVSILGLVIQGSVPTTVSLLATATVAVALQPLHRVLQRIISRLIYGLRDDPYAALAGLGRQLEATTGPEKVLPQAAATVAQALRLPYVAVQLNGHDTGSPALPAARYGREVPDTLHLELVYQGEDVGALVVGARAPGEPFTAADLRLLRDVARHIAQAAAGVQLTLALLRSRQQLIATRAQERRRLGRELHDGVNSALSEVVWGLQAARKWLRTDPVKADELLAAGLTRTHQGVETVRHISRGLRSPVDGVGVLDAIRDHIERFPAPVDIDIPQELPELPAAVEDAAYWIVVEALTNVLRHARASCCCVRLDVLDDSLTVTVTDNGCGLPVPLRLGVGLGSMRERAAEIGGTCQVRSRAEGGTEVAARLPRTLPGIELNDTP
ncbi:ATP-binding protein [Streptomyces sp. NPDC001820]|uniref:sensor histidine kinase n=1 Tax=Streptomyces sp. NPDC001820 TaxID=3364613 RepID=UPI0036AAB778